MLASASSGGTIAAVRLLGRSGYKVRVISSEVLCAAAWSRHVERGYSAPPEKETEKFLDRPVPDKSEYKHEALLEELRKTHKRLAKGGRIEVARSDHSDDARLLEKLTNQAGEG